MPRKRVKNGTAFAVRLRDGRFCAGQVLRTQPFLYVVIFSHVFDRMPKPEDSLGDAMLVGFVSDAAFVNGTWPAIGSRALLDEDLFACYVVEGPDGLVLKSFDGEVIRAAADVDRAQFGSRIIGNPAVFEGALDHYLFGGPEDWDYQRLRADVVRQKTLGGKTK